MNAILSIRPQFVEEIFSGSKKFEYRKNIFKRPVEKVYIYASAPVSRIVGEFEVAEILESTPKQIWQRTKRWSGIKKEWFDAYYQGRATAYAIEIKNLKGYARPRKLSVAAPQSFRYVDD
jgi:predicted transcriptional regulator